MSAMNSVGRGGARRRDAGVPSAGHDAPGMSRESHWKSVEAGAGARSNAEDFVWATSRRPCVVPGRGSRVADKTCSSFERLSGWEGRQLGILRAERCRGQADLTFSAHQFARVIWLESGEWRRGFGRPEGVFGPELKEDWT